MSNTKRILVLHGWNANPSERWFPIIKSYFEPKGYEVIIPKLPGNYFPDYKGWMDAISELNPDENTVLIGHSLGGAAILEYLEENNVLVAQAILVATPINSMGFNQIDNFFGTNFDYEKIKKGAKNFNLIYEEEDPVVPLEHGKILAQNLGAPLDILPGGLHMETLDMRFLEKVIDG